MNGVLNPFLRDERGAVAVYFALLAPILIAFAALGAEAGLWLITERKLQQIADASAYSAAARHMSSQNLTVLEQAARASATASGMVADDEFALYLPPQSGGFVGQSAYVQVAISREVPRYFSGLFAGTNAPVQISVRAVAGTDPDSGEPVCMLALSPSASPAFGVGGAGVVNVTECALSSNSSANNSFDMIGARVSVTGSCLYSVGGVDVSDGLHLTDCTEPQILQRPTANPFASLMLPTSAEIGGLIPRDSSSMTGTYTPSEALLAYPDLPAALFSGGLTIQGTVNLARGIYIVDGGTMKINANAVLSGTGVSFYLINGAKLDVAGGALLNVSAYDSSNPNIRTDPFAGLLFFSDGVGTPVSHSISGNSASQTNGVIYFPEDKLTYIGNSGSAYPCLQIMASTLTISGSGTLNIGCFPDLPPGTGQIRANQRIALVE